MKVRKDLGIHEMAVQIIVSSRAAELLGNGFFGFVEVAGWREFAGTHRDGNFVSKDEFLDFFGPAAVGLA